MIIYDLWLRLQIHFEKYLTPEQRKKEEEKKKEEEQRRQTAKVLYHYLPTFPISHLLNVYS